MRNQFVSMRPSSSTIHSTNTVMLDAGMLGHRPSKGHFASQPLSEAFCMRVTFKAPVYSIIQRF